MATRLVLSRASSRSREPAWRTEITVGRHDLVADEPDKLGGQDAGPAPFDHLLAGLLACTSITLRMYANKHDIPLQDIEVDAEIVRDRDARRNYVERRVRLIGKLDDAQRTRLEEIAEKTPVTLAVRDGLSLSTDYS